MMSNTNPLQPADWQILVVEDEFDSIQMVSKILQHHGAQVHIAHNGFECLETLKTLRPTLVIMDLALPEMDGWETLKRLRQMPHTADLPVVAITAYHSVSVHEDAVKAGFNGYFSKPLDTANIIANLSHIINQT